MNKLKNEVIRIKRDTAAIKAAAAELQKELSGDWN